MKCLIANKKSSNVFTFQVLLFILIVLPSLSFAQTNLNI